jgi:phosphatidylglycerol:prolipoprotein diacylglycerol transferase
VSAYPILLILGIALSFGVWSRLAKRDSRLLTIYIAAPVSAFVGAKVVYLLVEGWISWNAPERWLFLATGKTILGALLGGYAGVELAKKLVGYPSATGDWFAIVAPVAIALGRIGCLLHGCCLGTVCEPHWWTLRDAEGVARWRAVPIEIAFNLFAIGAFAVLRHRALLAGQHFHIYLIGYGAFRFIHEWQRVTPQVVLGWSGYQFAALAVLALGVGGFVRRARSTQSTFR